MIAAEGVLTARGGKTSHAAVVARGMGKTCVCGAEELDIDPVARRITVRDLVINEGDELSIDGSTGEVFRGAVPVVPSPVETYIESGLDAALTARRRRPRRWSRPLTGCSPTPTRAAGSGSAPTRTPARTPPGPAASARRASGCAAPSTCSSAIAAR